jgi:two-component system NtrC family sensor kinase
MFVSDPHSAPVGAVRGAALQLGDFARAASAVSGVAFQGGDGVGCVSLDGMTFEVVSVPVNLPDSGQSLGVLVVGERIGEAAVQEFKKLAQTEILLLADGQVTASTLPGLDAAEAVRQLAADGPSDQGAVELHGEHFKGLSGIYSSGGREREFRYVLLSSYEQSLRTLQDTRWTLISVSLAGILISGITVWLFVRRSIHPLRELRDSAEAVGRGDFSRRIERFSNDECGELAEAFNRMTGSLQGSRTELERTVETLKTTQTQLIQSEKLSAVGQFVAGVAHELNNPLTAVIGFSDLLVLRAENSPIKAQLEIVAKSAHRCHKIVQGLLSFARQHPPERGLTDVNATLEEVLEIMAYDLRTSNVEIVRDLQDGLPKIMADAHQLQQVFVNILSNARQAIQGFRHDGRIEVRTRLANSWLRIEFADNGPGIRQENLSKIFDPFFTTKPIGMGTGLGLSLSYGIIREHGGHIAVRSEVGQGAAFIIELPTTGINPTFVEDGAPASVRPVAVAPTGKAVLVVDDEEWIRILARELIKSLGHDVETAESGEKAVEALRRRKFDAVVCDWKMPGMGGIQFYEYILETSPALAGRIHFMTGDVINPSFQEFLRKNGKTCLAKPFSINDFQSVVEGLVADQ